MAFAASLGVAAATSLISIFVLVALGGANAYENLVIVSALTLLTTSATTYGITRRPDLAMLVSSLCTLITVGGGFAVIYIFFSWACGSDPSAC
jgi:hypothetical protein